MDIYSEYTNILISVKNTWLSNVINTDTISIIKNRVDSLKTSIFTSNKNLFKISINNANQETCKQLINILCKDFSVLILNLQETISMLRCTIKSHI
jgi:NifB/MoaA-like Fe-S oxidoreductase